jgi:hypothetical protein
VLYEGEKDHERVVERLDGATGRVDAYAGPRGHERVVDVQSPKAERLALQKQAVRDAHDELESLGENGHCNEHAVNQIAKRLKAIHEVLGTKRKQRSDDSAP